MTVDHNGINSIRDGRAAWEPPGAGTADPVGLLRRASVLLQAVGTHPGSPAELPGTPGQVPRLSRIPLAVRVALVGVLEQAADTLTGVEVPDDEPVLDLARALLGEDPLTGTSEPTNPRTPEQP